jgi:hypothetical protein
MCQQLPDLVKNHVNTAVALVPESKGQGEIGQQRSAVRKELYRV